MQTSSVQVLRRDMHAVRWLLIGSWVVLGGLVLAYNGATRDRDYNLRLACSFAQRLDGMTAKTEGPSPFVAVDCRNNK